MRIARYLAILALFIGSSARAEYLEGIEYVAINNPQPVSTGAKVEVREIFMYTCPHCFHFEPALEKWSKTMPANAELVRTPALFRPSAEPHARAYFALQALRAPAKVHYAIFEAIHAKRIPLNDEASLADFVAQYGVKAEAFRSAYHSMGVDADVRQAIELVPAYGVDSVPTIVVDGKYRTTGTMAGSNEAMLKVVDFLIKKAARERKPTKKGAKK